MKRLDAVVKVFGVKYDQEFKINSDDRMVISRKFKFDKDLGLIAYNPVINKWEEFHIRFNDLMQISDKVEVKKDMDRKIVKLTDNAEYTIEDCKGHIEYKEMTKWVHGLIDIVGLVPVFYNNNIDLIINDEGKLIEGMKPTLAITQYGKVIEVIYGNIMFCSHDKQGNSIGLNPKQLAIVKKVVDETSLLTTRKDVDEKYEAHIFNFVATVDVEEDLED